MCVGRILILSFLLAAHALAVWLLAEEGSSVTRLNRVAPDRKLVVSLIDTREPDVSRRLLTPDLTTPELDLPPLQTLELRHEDDDEAAPIQIHFRAPQLDHRVTVDKQPFVHAAGLESGRTAVVVLAIDVAEDGRVSSVIVERGTGVSRIDAAAAQYARSLRWRPGIVGDRPKSMRIRFTVAFSGGA